MTGKDATQLNILVVDDDDVVLNLLVTLLSRNGHQVVPAGSAEEILELLPYWTFHVAFLDHHLPGMEGLVLGEFLRRNNPEMTIALITGETDPALRKRSDASGLEYISKPFKSADIFGVVERHKEWDRQRRLRRLERSQQHWAPLLSEHMDALSDIYGVPNVPSRIEERLVHTVKTALNNLRAANRYSERDRTIALCGLICAKVLGVDLPKGSSGKTLYREYDELMKHMGRRQEFNGAS